MESRCARLLEEGVHEVLVVDVAKRLAAGVQRAALGEPDHVVSGGANLVKVRVKVGVRVGVGG